MQFFTPLLLTWVGAVAAVPATAAGSPDPHQITIGQVSFSGNGCPQNSVSTSLSTDGTVVTLGFDQFQTYIGPGTMPQDRSKNCQLHMELHYPGGFQFAVVDSTYHGYAQLDKGTKGSFFSTYFFSQNAGATTDTKSTIEGGGEWTQGKVYTRQAKIPTASIIYSPCGADGILNINNRIALTSTDSQASGVITTDDATVAFTQQINISWQTCRN